MRFSTYLLPLLPLLSSAAAKCYDEGDESNEDERAIFGADWLISPFCTALRGNYIRGEYRYNCVTVGRGKFHVRMQNTADGDRSLDFDDCMTWSKNENIGCHRMGISDYGDFNVQ
jgi:hypothetical protein